MKEQKFFDCILNNHMFIAPFKNIKIMYVIGEYTIRIVHSLDGSSYSEVRFKNNKDMLEQIEKYKEYLNSEDNVLI